MASGSVFVVSGPSGAGKGTLVERLRSAMPNSWVSVSQTTRDPRKGEVDGIDYIFVTPAQFEECVARDGFLEWARVHDHCYGSPMAPILEHMEAGDAVFLEIDVQGGFQVRDRYPDAHLIFIAPPSLEELERRLRGRGTDSEETIARRMENAVGEMQARGDYDVVIVNDDLDEATEEFVGVVQSLLGQKPNR